MFSNVFPDTLWQRYWDNSNAAAVLAPKGRQDLAGGKRNPLGLSAAPGRPSLCFQAPKWAQEAWKRGAAHISVAPSVALFSGASVRGRRFVLVDCACPRLNPFGPFGATTETAYAATNVTCTSGAPQPTLDMAQNRRLCYDLTHY